MDLCQAVPETTFPPRYSGAQVRSDLRFACRRCRANRRRTILLPSRAPIWTSHGQTSRGMALDCYRMRQRSDGVSDNVVAGQGTLPLITICSYGSPHHELL